MVMATRRVNTPVLMLSYGEIGWWWHDLSSRLEIAKHDIVDNIFEMHINVRFQLQSRLCE